MLYFIFHNCLKQCFLHNPSRGRRSWWQVSYCSDLLPIGPYSSLTPSSLLSSFTSSSYATAFPFSSGKYVCLGLFMVSSMKSLHLLLLWRNLWVSIAGLAGMSPPPCLCASPSGWYRLLPSSMYELYTVDLQEEHCPEFFLLIQSIHNKFCHLKSSWDT